MSEEKLDLLTSGAQFDVCAYEGLGRREVSPLRFIHRAALPQGGSVPLLKILLTNHCINDCAYCVNQVGRDCRRGAYQPHELAKLFMELHRKRLVEGLFLSSGIGVNATRTMEEMVKTVEILRRRYEFYGYVHLKILPGASFDCVEAGCRVATRISVNIEAPTVQHLARLSSGKNLYRDILERMRWVKRLTGTNPKLVPSGQTTQFVVGAAGETDRDILHTTEALYRELGLKRVYYSAFRPVRNSRLEQVSPAPPLREHRLYQTDWLLRVYGFSPQEVELALGKTGHLPINRDPKMLIAQRQPWLFPVDINRATYAELLRVPGIGPTSARRIVAARADHSIDSLEQLARMRVVVSRAAPFIWLPGLKPEKQTSFLPDLEETLLPEAPSLAQALG